MIGLDPTFGGLDLTFGGGGLFLVPPQILTPQHAISQGLACFHGQASIRNGHTVSLCRMGRDSEWVSVDQCLMATQSNTVVKACSILSFAVHTILTE